MRGAVPAGVASYPMQTHEAKFGKGDAKSQFATNRLLRVRICPNIGFKSMARKDVLNYCTSGLPRPLAGQKDRVITCVVQLGGNTRSLEVDE